MGQLAGSFKNQLTQKFLDDTRISVRSITIFNNIYIAKDNFISLERFTSINLLLYKLN